MKDHLEVCEAAARAGGSVLREWLGKFAVANKGPRDLVTEADLASQREIRRIVLGAFPEHGFVGEESLPDATGTPAADSGTSGAGGNEPSLRWHVDPLDGTSNYVHGFPAYCVSVALARGDEILVGTVYDPVQDECFTARAGGGAFLNGRRISASRAADLVDALVAVSFPPHVAVDSRPVTDFLAVLPHVHSIRRTGSTAINLAYLACGRIDAFWVRRIASWDVAAGLLLVAEAGAAIGQFGGARSTGVSLDNPVFIAASTPKLLADLQSLMPA
jgi:myo-inositol-1(or 4)-monophosphatase